MTDNTEAGLLDDIIANPADDVPRLILADWLEDHGRYNTARFIRQQIAGEVGMVPLLDVVRIVDPMGIGGLGRRKASKEDCIWKRNDSSERLVFRRGFVAEVHAPLSVLREHLPRLVQEQPIEAVRVTDKRPAEYDAAGETPTDDNPATQFAWWRWEPGGRADDEDDIPTEVWDLLEGDYVSDTDLDKTYPTADAAHAALSVAMLRWAKAHPLTRDVHLS